jgi:hypothetical protein
MRPVVNLDALSSAMSGCRPGVRVTLRDERSAADEVCGLLVPTDTTTMIGATDDQSCRHNV